MIVLAGLQRDQADQVQRFGVISFAFERLPATELGFEVLAGGKVPDGGFVERRGCGCGRHGQFGGLVSRPALARGHRNVSVDDRSST